MILVEGLSPLDLLGPVDQERLVALGALLPGRNLRRVPRLARLALLAAGRLDPEPGEKTALVLATAYASVATTFDFLNSILDDGPDLASPTAFSHSVTNMAAALLSQHLGLGGPALTLTQNRFGPALSAAALLLEAGLAESVLLGAIGEHEDMMSRLEDLAHPGGRSRMDEGALFFKLKLAGTKAAPPEPPLDLKETAADGPLAQAGALARRLLANPGPLKVISEDGGAFDLHYPGAGL